MKTFFKIFALIALTWAILIPFLLAVLNAADGVGPVTEGAHSLARYLNSTVPQGPVSDTTFVSIPAQRVINSEAFLDLAADDVQKTLMLQNFNTWVSSVVIVILSVCLLKTCKREAKTTA